MATEAQPLPRWSDDPKAYRREWMRRKRKSDPTFARQQADAARAWQKDNPARNAWNQYRQRANRKSLAWELSADLFEELLITSCHYCGSEPDPINGVDRIDNEHGYTPSNVVTACARCNYAKRDMSVAEFLAWAEQITNFRRAL